MKKSDRTGGRLLFCCMRLRSENEIARDQRHVAVNIDCEVGLAVAVHVTIDQILVGAMYGYGQLALFRQ